MEPRENKDIAGGSIHHFSGVIHIPGGTIANVRQIMQDYPNYPKYFKPDVGKGVGVRSPDSTPTDEHYTSHISLIQSTIWIAVSYDCIYDTHYRYLDPHHWESVSSATSIKEWRDPKDVSQGYYPEGDDHGFLWRTQYLLVCPRRRRRRRCGTGQHEPFTPHPDWLWMVGHKTTHDAVEKMLRDMKAAVEALH